MRGKLEIEAVPGVGISVKMGLHDVTGIDFLALMDGLAQGFHLSQEDRMIVGTLFAAGGINGIPGAELTTMEIHPALWNRIREKGKKIDDE